MKHYFTALMLGILFFSFHLSAPRADTSDHASNSSCELPVAKKDESLVVVRVDKPTNISSLTLSGQAGITNAVSVKISKGTQKIYIAAISPSAPTIWQFTGDTGRVAQLVLIGKASKDSEPQIGSTGINTQKIAISSARNCDIGDYYIPNEKKQEKLESLYEKAFGKKADKNAAFKNAQKITLSEKSIFSLPLPLPAFKRPAPKGFDKTTWAMPNNNFRGDIVNIPFESVVSKVKDIKPYSILPGWAGLAELVARGDLLPIRKDGCQQEILITPPENSGQKVKERVLSTIEYVQAPLAGFKLVKNIPNYPAGLSQYDTSPRFFVIGKGISMPAGDFGTAINIYCEESQRKIPASGHCP